MCPHACTPQVQTDTDKHHVIKVQVITAGLKLHTELSHVLGSIAQMWLRYAEAGYMLIGRNTMVALTGKDTNCLAVTQIEQSWGSFTQFLDLLYVRCILFELQG